MDQKLLLQNCGKTLDKYAHLKTAEKRLDCSWVRTTVKSTYNWLRQAVLWRVSNNFPYSFGQAHHRHPLPSPRCDTAKVARGEKGKHSSAFTSPYSPFSPCTKEHRICLSNRFIARRSLCCIGHYHNGQARRI